MNVKNVVLNTLSCFDTQLLNHPFPVSVPIDRCSPAQRAAAAATFHARSSEKVNDKTLCGIYELKMMHPELFYKLISEALLFSSGKYRQVK